MDSGIYLITNKETNQKYVGGSINIKKRLNEHKRNAHINSQYIDRAIKKNGFKNFDYQIITLLPPDWDIISKHEKYWIKYYNTFENPKHYNLTEGGEGTVGYIPHNSARQKMSDAKKGSNHPFWKDSPRIVKSGIKNGKENYAIKYEGKILKQSVHYEFLEYLLDKFINNELTENQVRNYDIRKYKFKYTCVKRGYNRNGIPVYGIYSYGKGGKTLINSIEKRFINLIVNKLNNKEISEEEIIKTPTKILKKIIIMEAAL